MESGRISRKSTESLSERLLVDRSLVKSIPQDKL